MMRTGNIIIIIIMLSLFYIVGEHLIKANDYFMSHHISHDVGKY